MATFAARRLHDMVDNAQHIIAIELLAAVQGIEFHAPHVSSTVLQGVIRRIREDVAHYDRDRYFAPDIKASKAIIESGYFLPFISELLPSTRGH